MTGKTPLHNHEPNYPNKPFLTLKESANFLGISTSLMYKLSANKLIPKYKPAGTVYFKIEDLISWIEKGKINSADEIKADTEELLNTISKRK